jgi:chemotaxis protein MotB
VVEVAAPARDDLQDLKDQFKADGVSVRYRERGLSIGIPSSVTFAPGQAKVSDQGRDVLGRVAKVVRQRFADKTIYVEGHTDTDPIRKSKDRFRSNRHLSAERADAVATYLEKSGGIASRKIVIVGFGPWDPEDPADKAANRRVEIVIAER